MTKNGVNSMKVDAVRNLNLVHNYNFGAKEKNEKEDRIVSQKNSSMMTKVPVIVLLAMNPATLNSAIPKLPRIENPNQLLILAPEPKLKDNYQYTFYPGIEEISQAGDEFELPSSNQTALYVQKFKYNAHNYIVAYADNGYTKDVINNIYFYRDGKIDNPDLLTGIIHHKSGDGKEFYGAMLSKNIYKNNKHTTTIDYELRLPSEISDYIIKIINNNSDYKANLKYIKFYESDSSYIMKPKTTRYE